jgi:hypothetical protein
MVDDVKAAAGNAVAGHYLIASEAWKFLKSA